MVLEKELASVKDELTETRETAATEFNSMMERTAAIQNKMSERQHADSARVSTLLLQVCDLQAQLEEQRSNYTREHSVRGTAKSGVAGVVDFCVLKVRM